MEHAKGHVGHLYSISSSSFHDGGRGQECRGNHGILYRSTGPHPTAGVVVIAGRLIISAVARQYNNNNSFTTIDGFRTRDSGRIPMAYCSHDLFVRARISQWCSSIDTHRDAVVVVVVQNRGITTRDTHGHHNPTSNSNLVDSRAFVVDEGRFVACHETYDSSLDITTVLSTFDALAITELLDRS